MCTGHLRWRSLFCLPQKYSRGWSARLIMSNGRAYGVLDDLEELHFYGDAWIAWVNPQGSWAVASITEPFGLSQGVPSSVTCRNVMAIFFFFKQVFFIPLCCFLILYQENPAKWRGSRWWNTLIKYIFWSLGLFRILLQWLEKVTINYLDKSVLLSAPSPADC